MVEKTTGRNLNIECLRVLMMLLITIMHISGWSINTNELRIDYSLNNLWILLYRQVTYLGVPTFAFISGYYGIKCRYRKLFSLECMAISYGIATILINIAFCHRVGVFLMGNILMPASSGRLWYYSAYIYIMLISPFISLSLNKMDEKTRKLSIIIFIIFSYIFRSVMQWQGNDFLMLLSIYFMGQYLRMFPDNFIKRNAGIIFIITQIINLGLICVLHLLRQGGWISILEGTINPVTLLSSISLFYVVFNMKNEKKKTIKIISLVAPYMLAVYVFTGDLRVSGILDFMKTSPIEGRFELVFPISCLVLFLVALIEKVRGLLFFTFEEKMFCRFKALYNKIHNDN